MTYVLEIFNLLFNIIWVLYVLVFWFSGPTLSFIYIVHLDIRVIFLYVCYYLMCYYGETYVCVTYANKILNPVLELTQTLLTGDLYFPHLTWGEANLSLSVMESVPL